MTCSHCGTEWTDRSTFCPECGYADQERLRSVRIAPSAMPTRKNSVPPARPNNSFEKGHRLDERGLPYLNSDGQPLKMKETFDPRKYERSNRPRINVHSGGES